MAKDHQDDSRVYDINKEIIKINEELEIMDQNLKEHKDKFKDTENVLIDSEIELEIETKILNGDIKELEKYKPIIENEMKHFTNQNPDFVSKMHEFDDIRKVSKKVLGERIERESFQRKTTIKKGGSQKFTNFDGVQDLKNEKAKEEEDTQQQFANRMKRLSMDKNALINSLLNQELEKGITENIPEQEIMSNVSSNLEEFKINLSKKLNEFISEKLQIGKILDEIKEANENEAMNSPVKRKQAQLNNMMEHNLNVAENLEKDYAKYELANQDLAGKLINFFKMNESVWEGQKEEYNQLRDTLLGRNNKEKLDKKVTNARRNSLEAFSQTEQGKMLLLEIKVQLENLKGELKITPDNKYL